MNRRGQRQSYNSQFSQQTSSQTPIRNPPLTLTIRRQSRVVNVDDFGLYLTGSEASNHNGQNFLVIPLPEWREFVHQLQNFINRVRYEERKEPESNFDLVSNVKSLQVTVNAILSHQTKKLAKNEVRIDNLKNEAKKCKMKNQELKRQLQQRQHGAKNMKQMKRVLYSIRRKSNTRSRRRTNTDRSQCHETTTSNHSQHLKHRLCYNCRQKGHIASNCPTQRIAYMGPLQSSLMGQGPFDLSMFDLHRSSEDDEFQVTSADEGSSSHDHNFST